MEKVNIKSVAIKSGVSIATVSRVLNNKANVKEEIKQRVLNTIEETGYQRNFQASGLRANQSFSFTLLYSDPSPSYVTQLQKGALAECERQHYSLTIYPCDHRQDDFLKKIHRLVCHTKSDGLIIAPPICDNQDVINLLDEKKIPYARISPFQVQSDLPSVLCDDFSAAYKMASYLISLGHERIAFIRGTEGHSASLNRLNGYLKALKENGIPANDDYIEQGAFSFESGEQCTRRLLRKKNRPTAIFACNDEMAAGVMKVARQMNIEIPVDLSVAGFDDDPIARHMWPALTTIKQPISALASEAVRMLINHNTELSEKSSQSDFDCELVIRESTSTCRR
ncbi:LacI family DNA-binding transcriptional regulator [Thalassotalea crassostreae]|uniref:LacI family DNA-binding transcriptional regulator n=1 Tax=Thalassotalea crassostreae TaxID=1763536 RepID=UPI0008395CB0|nr:LacI family DNA-binding transcriptional regulator [Thalassotalea crassostreae]